MSICQVSVELSNYLDSQEKALQNFTSCLPEYRDKVANEVVALLAGGKSEEEEWMILYDWRDEDDITFLQDLIARHRAYSPISLEDLSIIKGEVKEALEYYSEVLYNCSLEEMLEDNDGTTIESWVESVL
jgi:hypothetical protein